MRTGQRRCAVLDTALAILVHSDVTVSAAYDQVVQHLDTQYFARRHQIIGDGDVVVAERRVLRRMIMDHDQRMGVVQYGRLEYLRQPHHGAVHIAYISRGCC